MISTTVKMPTPIAASDSPPIDSAINVTIAAAAEFTKLLQIRIIPIKRSGRSSSFSVILRSHAAFAREMAQR